MGHAMFNMFLQPTVTMMPPNAMLPEETLKNGFLIDSDPKRPLRSGAQKVPGS